ncbi:MAG: SPOR domain-containing protein [Azoarcus sp.]|nr:SPOR domain-containing protein [Azoarcus sp.]
MSDPIDFMVSDTELEIKKRARRRLVGAAVLALLAVIVLPLALRDRDEPRVVSDMHVFIPEHGDGGFKSHRAMPEDDPESASVVIEPDAASGVPGFPVDNAPSFLSEPSSSPQRALMPPEQHAPNPPAARLPEESRQKDSPPRPGASEKQEATRALALLNGKSPVKEADEGKKTGKEAIKTQDRVFIQVGAFGNADRAARQAKELNDQGFAAYAEKAGRVTRVRIGPLSRSEGEQVMARLKAQSHKAVLSSH